MCCGCWESDGVHKIDNTNVREAALLGKRIIHFGAAHIVIADNNIDDWDIEFCLSHDPDPDEKKWLRLMRRLSYEERVSVMGIIDGCWKPVGE